MKKIAIHITALVSFFTYNTLGQTVLLDVDRNKDTIPQTFGQNLKYFSHPVYAIGFVFGESNADMPAKAGASYDFRVGFRTKRKVTPVFSYGYDFFYHAVNYFIDQRDGKKIPDTLMHKSQKYNFFSLGMGWYIRFNFDPRRGNYLGTYVDAGITGEWDFTARTVTRDILPGNEKIKVIAKNFDYVNYFSSRIFVRGGKSRVLVYGSYRITDHFKSSSEFPELPRFTGGLELNLF